MAKRFFRSISKKIIILLSIFIISNVAIASGSDITVSLHLDRDEYFVNEVIKISAAISDRKSGIAEANVILYVTQPNNKIEKVILYNDGLHDDGMKDDGVYANFYTNTQLPGRYEFIAEAKWTGYNKSEPSSVKSRSKWIFIKEGKREKYISLIPKEEFTLAEVYPGLKVDKKFVITSSKGVINKFEITDFKSDDDTIIGRELIHIYPSILDLPANRPREFKIVFYHPVDKQLKSGTYKGFVLAYSALETAKIPIVFSVSKYAKPAMPKKSPSSEETKETDTIYIEHSSGGMLGESKELIKIYKENDRWIVERYCERSSFTFKDRKIEPKGIMHPMKDIEKESCRKELDEEVIEQLITSIEPSPYYSEGFITDHYAHCELLINLSDKQIWAGSTSNVGSLGPWNAIIQDSSSRSLFKMQGDKTLAIIRKISNCENKIEDLISKPKWKMPRMKSLLTRYLSQRAGDFELRDIRHGDPFTKMAKNISGEMMPGPNLTFVEAEVDDFLFADYAKAWREDWSGSEITLLILSGRKEALKEALQGALDSFKRSTLSSIKAIDVKGVEGKEYFFSPFVDGKEAKAGLISVIKDEVMFLIIGSPESYSETKTSLTSLEIIANSLKFEEEKPKYKYYEVEKEAIPFSR